MSESLKKAGHSCNFKTGKNGIFYTQGEWAALADAFDCADFSWQRNTTPPTPNTGLCEVSSPIGCLCDAYKAIPDFVEDSSTVYNN